MCKRGTKYFHKLDLDVLFTQEFFQCCDLDKTTLSLSFVAKREDEDYDEQVEEVLQDEVKMSYNAKMQGEMRAPSFSSLSSPQDENDVYILTKVSDVLHSVFSSYKEKVLPWFEHLLPLIVQLIVSVTASS